ncbi:MAG: site-specific integrase [Hyphomonadaceae bacterium]
MSRPRRPTRNEKLTQSVVKAALPEAERYSICDTEIPGFSLVVRPNGRRSFYFRYRVAGGERGTIREPKIGEAPGLKTDAARKIAGDWHALVRQGGDPSLIRQEARQAPTMSDLFDRYLTDHARPKKKASSVAEDERTIQLHLKPRFGKQKVAEVTRADIDKFHKGLSKTPYRANRCIALLSKALSLAEVWGWREDGTNPVRHVSKFAEKKRKRYLSLQEFAALGEALRKAEAGELLKEDGTPKRPISPYAIAAIRLLAFTGARRGEILNLQWDWIDWQASRVCLPDSKTGEKFLTLNPPALAILKALPRVEGNPHVIVGGRLKKADADLEAPATASEAEEGTALVNIKDPWAIVRAAAGLDDVRIHDLRHSFASVGAAGGLSLPIIGAMLGHSQPQTTARYAHVADDPMQAASKMIANKVEAAMSGRSAEVVRLKG